MSERRLQPDAGPVDLSVVVVSWNTADLTVRALEAVPEAAEPFSVQRICVDNGSADGTPSRVRERLPDVLLLENGANLGFGAGFNRALPHLRGRHTCALNADARPRAGSLAPVVRWLDARAEAVVASPPVVREDGRPEAIGRPAPTLRGLLHDSTVLSVTGLGRAQARPWRRGVHPDAPSEVHNLVGVCLVVRTSWLRRLGGFDPDYFFYWEDTDLCRRVRRGGGEVWVVAGGPPVEHRGGGATPPFDAAYRRRYVEGLARYVRGGVGPRAGDAFVALVVVGFWLHAWHKGLTLALRAALQATRGLTEPARRSWASARGWVRVVEREGGALLRALRRPRLRADRTDGALP